jgi:hypothetical protein
VALKREKDRKFGRFVEIFSDFSSKDYFFLEIIFYVDFHSVLIHAGKRSP